MDKRLKILNAALNLFVRNGIDSTSTAKIAKEAGVASGLIFHHFKNKENLVKELYLFIKEKLANNIGENIDLVTFTEAKFKRLWLESIKQGFENVSQIRFLHQYNYSQYITLEERKEGKMLFSMQRSFFQNGIDNGILKDIDLDFMTEFIFEQSLFIIMYIDDNKLYENKLEECFNLVRDMFFK